MEENTGREVENSTSAQATKQVSAVFRGLAAAACCRYGFSSAAEQNRHRSCALTTFVSHLNAASGKNRTSGRIGAKFIVVTADTDYSRLCFHTVGGIFGIRPCLPAVTGMVR